MRPTVGRWKGEPAALEYEHRRRQTTAACSYLLTRIYDANLRRAFARETPRSPVIKTFASHQQMLLFPAHKAQIHLDMSLTDASGNQSVTQQQRVGSPVCAKQPVVQRSMTSSRPSPSPFRSCTSWPASLDALATEGRKARPAECLGLLGKPGRELCFEPFWGDSQSFRENHML